MKHKRTFALTALTILITLSSCQNKESERRKDPLDENYQLIDRGSYSEAIDSLTVLSATDKRPQVLVTLASAYAARAGIKVDQYWGFVVGFKAPLMTAENVKVHGSIESLQRILQQANGQVDPKDMQALGGLIRTLEVWDKYKDRVEAIPIVQATAKRDLHTAVDILANVRTAGGRLYRAILNLILFKTYVTSSQDFWASLNVSVQATLDGKARALCKIEFKDLLNWLNPVSYHLIETLTDLTIAFPESEGDLIEARDVVQGIYSSTKVSVRELREQRMCP